MEWYLLCAQGDTSLIEEDRTPDGRSLRYIIDMYDEPTDPRDPRDFPDNPCAKRYRGA